MAVEDLSFRVRVDEIEKALATIPGMTAKELKKTARVAAKEWGDVEGAAKKAAKESAREWEKQSKAIEKVGDKATGGLVGDFLDLGEALGALGPYGAAAAGALLLVTGAAVGTVAAVIGVTMAAEDSIKALDELKGWEGAAVSDETRASIEQANAVLDGFGVLLDQLVVLLAENVAPTVIEVGGDLLNLGIKATEMAGDFLKTHDILEEFAIALGVVVVDAALGAIRPLIYLGEALGWVGEQVFGLEGNALTQLNERLHEGERAAVIWATGIDGMRDGAGQLEGKAADLAAAILKGKNAKKDDAKAAKEAEQANSQLGQVYERLGAIAVQTYSDTDDALIKADLAFKATTASIDEQAAKVDELAKKATDLDAVEQARAKVAQTRADAEQRYYRDRVDALDEVTKASQEALDKRLKASEIEESDYIAQSAALQKIETDRLDQMLAERQAAYQALGAMGENATQEELAQRQALEGEIATLTKARVDQQMQAEAAIGEARKLAFDEAIAKAKQYFEESAAIKAADPILGAIQNAAKAAEEFAGQRLDAIAEERAKIKESMDGQTDAEKAQSKARLRMLREQERDEKAKIRASFRAQQAAQVAMAVVDAARASLALIPAFAFLGPGAPLAAAAVAGAGLAAQLATIKGQEPKFHRGLDPSERPAILTSSEGVANGRAMADPGFREELRAANAGERSSGGGTMVLALNDRILAALDARTALVTGRGTSRLLTASSTHYAR